MPVVGHYHHVHLISPDPRAAAEWFVEFLGGNIFKDEELRGARNVRVRLGECMLNIRGERESDTIEKSITGKQRFGIDHFCLEVGGLEGMLQEVTAKGGEIPEPLFELPSGNRAAYVAGPDGVVIELIEPKA